MHVGRAAQGVDSDNAKGKTQGVDKGVERGHEKDTAVRGPGEGATDQTADGVSLATPASSLNEHGDIHRRDHRTPSLPLEGERNSQAMSGSTRAHSEGAAPPDGTMDVQGGIQSLSPCLITSSPFLIIPSSSLITPHPPFSSPLTHPLPLPHHPLPLPHHPSPASSPPPPTSSPPHPASSPPPPASSPPPPASSPLPQA
ncbi:hypothetical protein BU15DRAFT_71134 [Melanogaster broomeanus]|nr:hypothetical protein BU15DRAFT_71134 [Melanogaster broomeanus]